MYDERKNRFSLRDIILQILLIVLFVFIMVWLFPTKNYLKENNTVDNSQLYSNYITSMSNAAKDYFTTDKVPTKVGESVKLTLNEMLEKKLVLPIGGNAVCDLNESYIEVTKMDKDYQLKVALSCEEYSDYVVITLGCKDFCNLVCGTTTPTTPTTPSKPSTTNPTQQSTKKYTVTFDSNGGSAVSSQTVVSGKKATKPANPTREGYTFVQWTLNGNAYDFNSSVTKNITLVATWKQNVVEPVVMYQYVKPVYSTYTYYEWSDWSDTQRVWEKNKTFTNTSTTEYQVVKSGSTAFNGKYTCSDDEIIDKQPAELVTETVYADFVTNTTSKYSAWKVVSEEYVSATPLKSTSTEKYDFVRTQVNSLCTGCAQTMEYVYKYSTRTLEEASTKTCPTGYTKSSSGKNCYKETEVYSCAKYGEGYTKTVLNNCIKRGYECRPEFEDFTDYQYRNYETKTGYTTTYDYKWSYSNNDSNLIKQGYSLTGKTK